MGRGRKINSILSGTFFSSQINRQNLNNRLVSTSLNS